MSEGAHAIKFGTRVRYNRDANSTDANFNGSFSFQSLGAYVTMLNGIAAGQTWAQIAAAGGLPNKLNYTTGAPAVVASVFDGALFVQDDWKANANLTLSGASAGSRRITSWITATGVRVLLLRTRSTAIKIMPRPKPFCVAAMVSSTIASDWGTCLLSALQHRCKQPNTEHNHEPDLLQCNKPERN